MVSSLPVTGNTRLTKPENRAFYPALDGLRAIAFFMVFLQHYAHMPWGWTGVDLFFVLSGFLITGILFDSRDDPHRVRNFYVRRTLRIFPLYYGVMLALVLTWPVFHWQWSWAWLVWPAYLGNYARFFHDYAQGSALQRLADFQPLGFFPNGKVVVLTLGHFWSLCVEEQFYLLWPWIVFWIRDRRKLLWICVASLPVSLALRLYGQQTLPRWMLDNEVCYRSTPFRLDALLLGGLIALVLRGAYADRLKQLSRILLPPALAIVLGRALLPSALPFSWLRYIYPSWMFTWGLTIIDLVAALLIVNALQPGNWVYRLLNQRPLRWAGRVSYGAYILHDIPHVLYMRLGGHISASHSHSAGILLALVSTFLLAWLSFRFFESPFLNLKERWTLRT